MRLSDVILRAPRVPVMNNVDVACASSADATGDALVRQLYSPMHWVETIQSLKQQGADRIVEVGPGKVLSGLIKRIDSSIQNVAVADLKTLRDYLSQ